MTTKIPTVDWIDADRIFVDKRARIQFRMDRRAAILWQMWFIDYHSDEYHEWMEARGYRRYAPPQKLEWVIKNGHEQT